MFIRITMGLVWIVLLFFPCCSLRFFSSFFLPGPILVDGMRVVAYAVLLLFLLVQLFLMLYVIFGYRDIMRYITETFCGYVRELSLVIYGLGLIRVIENGRRCLSRSFSAVAEFHCIKQK